MTSSRRSIWSNLICAHICLCAARRPWCRSTGGKYLSLRAATESIAPKIGGVLQALNKWGNRDEVDTETKGWHHDVRERAQEGAGMLGHGTAASQRDPEAGKCFLCTDGARLQTEAVRAFIDQHRNTLRPSGSTRARSECGPV